MTFNVQTKSNTRRDFDHGIERRARDVGIDGVDFGSMVMAGDMPGTTHRASYTDATVSTTGTIIWRVYIGWKIGVFHTTMFGAWEASYQTPTWDTCPLRRRRHANRTTAAFGTIHHRQGFVSLTFVTETDEPETL